MGFLVKKINGIYHFLVQAKLECGNFDIVELAPTCLLYTSRLHYSLRPVTLGNRVACMWHRSQLHKMVVIIPVSYTHLMKEKA